MSDAAIDSVDNGAVTEDPNIPFQRMSGRDDLLRDIFDSHCKIYQPSYICDVGAFNGDESYRFAAAMPESTVVAFEASPRNYKQFYLDSERFANLPNFRINHRAISDYNGEITFNVLDAGEANDWRRAANSILPRTDGVASTAVTVPCSTLDASFGANIIKRNTFALWIDVEGALDKVLLGAQEVLKKTLFLRAEVEWKEFWSGQKLAPEMKELIASYGFELLGDSHLPNAYDQSDVLFVNKRLGDLIDRN
ncbi:FkbM family methyltransferase [Sphingomonas sp. QA11]|uniref:FkbM family methyltransferase n=1 Tax=Sphingomonas sp. QA11 TaxID=2950605 RepID=UPI0023497724|nr:FkbM family methyltransferase [Sphingomonas sp. QA11]WCM29071.1 FkbM family methyltransferase [Sphingomonas sp. QA11]